MIVYTLKRVVLLMTFNVELSSLQTIIRDVLKAFNFHENINSSRLKCLSLAYPTMSKVLFYAVRYEHNIPTAGDAKQKSVQKFHQAFC